MKHATTASLIAGIVTISMTTACSLEEATSQGIDDNVQEQMESSTTSAHDWKVLNREFSASEVRDGVLFKRGTMDIALSGRPAHRMKVELRQRLAKGDEDVQLIVQDTTVNDVGVYTCSDEASEGSIMSGRAIASVVVNADDTIAVNGSTFQTDDEAAQALSATDSVLSLSTENMAAAVATMESELDDTDKGSKVSKYVKKAVNIMTKAIKILNALGY